MGPFFVVIPARFASTRLPGKPLSDIHGTPMVVRVAQQARSSNAADVVVAVDDPRVADVLDEFGVPWTMTRVDHTSGSDRVMEVVTRRGWAHNAVVVNVQGDEPLIPPVVINQVADLLSSSTAGVATLCEPIIDRAQVFDPNVVKVVRSEGGRALYFSRAPIPWNRDDFESMRGGELPRSAWWRHIGIYGYRVSALTRFCQLRPAPTETIESLEQLRLLHNDIDIIVAPAAAEVPGGIDTPADLARVRSHLGQTKA